MALSVLGVLAWVCFFFCFYVGLASLVHLGTPRHMTSVLFLLLAVSAGFVFSFIAGFSIGRFTPLLPLLLTGIAIGRVQGWWAWLITLPAAVSVYWLLSWGLTDVQIELARGSLAWALLFGAWGINLEWLVSVAAILAVVLPIKIAASRPG